MYSLQSRSHFPQMRRSILSWSLNSLPVVCMLPSLAGQASLVVLMDTF